MENRDKLIKIFEAIELDDHLPVREILKTNMLATLKIPTKQLCGLAIIAAENNAINITKEFYKYNILANDNDLSKYLDIALKIVEDNKKNYKEIKSEMVH